MHMNMSTLGGTGVWAMQGGNFALGDGDNGGLAANYEIGSATADITPVARRRCGGFFSGFCITNPRFFLHEWRLNAILAE